MLLLKLTIENFGVFRGRHTFELAPRVENDQKRHLTIFSGHNGSGKTTLFHAMRLALHGSAYLENVLASQKYHGFILNRIHRFPDAAEQVSESGVALSFEYVRSGKPATVEVERRWKRQGLGIREALNVLVDGLPPEIDSADYQTWIDDFISPGIGQLCFFDAEQLDALASQDQQSTVLQDTLTRLLGLDRVLRLDADLEQLMNRQGSTKKVDNLYTRLLDLQVARDKLDNQIDILQKELAEVHSDISSCEATLTKQERLLAAEGGAYAARQPVLKSRLSEVQKEVELLSAHLREMCGDLLPFALAPELCLQLHMRLTAEIEIRRQHTVNTLLQEKLPEIEMMLTEDTLWEGLDISPSSRSHIIQQLTEKLKTFGEVQVASGATIVHQLSEPEHQQLRSWISQVMRDIPQQVQLLGSRLKALKKEQRRIEADVQRAPDDEILAPIHTEISRLKGILATKQKRQVALNEQIGSLQFQRDVKQRTLQDTIEQYSKLQKFEKQLKYAESSRNIICTYRDVLTRHKLRMLEETLITSFNTICRKEHLLSKAHISPDNFDIRLIGVDGSPLKLSDFSAGERQLYAMALLWALRLVSKLPLPLAIDTPLARLDEVHRLRLIHDYIPMVSDQVLLFSTDAELDSQLQEEAKFETARIYRLNYNPEQGRTIVTSDRDTSLAHKDSSLFVNGRVGAYGI